MIKKIKITLLITIILITILGVINLIFTRKSSNPTNTTPLTPSQNTKTPAIFTPPATLTKKSFSLIWDNTVFENPNNQYLSYQVEDLLSKKTFDSIAQKLNFTSDQKNIIDSNNEIYKTQSQQEILLYTAQEQAINYQNLTKPSNLNLLSDQAITSKSIELLNKILPEQTFIVNQIKYFKSNYYSDPTTPSNAEISQAFLTQKVDNLFPMIPSNISSQSVVVITYNKDLSLNNFIINNGYSKQVIPLQKYLFDIQKLKSYSSTDLLNLTPLRLDKQTIFNDAKEIKLIISKVSVGYININQSLLPVYIIKGNLNSSDQKLNEEVIYTAPIN